MRRENERLLEQHIMDYMDEAAQHIASADVIFLHAPGVNKTYFLAESRPLKEQAHKLRSIMFPNKKANTSEASDLIRKITEISVKFT